MRLFFLTILLSGLLFSSESISAEDAVAKMKEDFETMKKGENKAFSSYKENLQKEFNAYKNELSEFWKDPALSSKKKWVSYSDDKKSRSKVDFENNSITIEVIAETLQDANKRLGDRLAYAISKDTQEVINTDPLQKRISTLSKESDLTATHTSTKPILSNIFFDAKPTPDELNSYTDRVVAESKVEVSGSNSRDELKNVYKITVALPEDSMLKRSEVYKEEVIKNATRFKIPIPLVFAIMHTESNFNPFAKSHIPAFGLMQIVPTSAGKDIYKFLYKKKGMPSATYLYNGQNNIEMGSTYLHILYYRYLRKIKNPESRLYCSIAAYNTGPGNIAWAFIGVQNMAKAAPSINTMTPDEVYSHLLSNLRYDEPKQYLKKVKKRMSSYKKAYEL